MPSFSSSHLLIIGDSVTDCGRARPVGAGAPPALGHGYVQILDTTLRNRDPGRTGRITNMGISGNTIRDLTARWETDVLAQKPDWLAVMIGINDVWRYFDSVKKADAVPPAEFESTYESLIVRTQSKLRGLVLMTPFYIEPNLREPMRARMDIYGAIVTGLARRHQTILVDTQAAFDLALTRQPFESLAPDKVHPTEAGHQVLAQAFLSATNPAT
jgi:lysophospholipase L1-like esterase